MTTGHQIQESKYKINCGFISGKIKIMYLV